MRVFISCRIFSYVIVRMKKKENNIFPLLFYRFSFLFFLVESREFCFSRMQEMMISLVLFFPSIYCFCCCFFPDFRKLYVDV